MFTLLLLPALAGGCRPAPRPAPVAIDVTPSVTVTPTVTAAGRPVAVRYRWQVGSGFRQEGRPYGAFVHFLAGDGAILIQDDHEPKPPSKTWSSGATYEYTRLLFTHYQFPGPLEIRVGLVDEAGGTRVALRGQDLGQASYRAGAVDVRRHPPQEETRFYAGFSPPWTDSHRPFDSYRWMDQEGVLACRNPRADAVLLLRAQADTRASASAPRLRIAAGGVVRDYSVPDDETFTLAVPVSSRDVGSQEWTDVTLTMSHTYRTSAGRAVGLLVERAVLCPASEVPAEVLDAVTVL